MKKILLGMAAVSTLAIAAPAAAQYPYQGNGNVNANANVNGGFDARIGQLQTQLDAGIRQGTISRQEAQPLRMQLRQLSRLEMQYGRNGFTGQERADLQQRVRTLRQQIRMADGRGNGRWGDDDDRYGDRDDRDDRYGERDDDGRWQNGERIDRDRDGYDDRDTDRDGRWDDNDQQGGRGGVINRVVDGLTGSGGLRVGQRVSANLGAVPYQYRAQYRDGNGVYYRSDGRRIYQVDARTDTVVRIYPVSG